VKEELPFVPLGENESDSGFEMVNHSSFEASLATTNGNGLLNGNEFAENNGTNGNVCTSCLFEFWSQNTFLSFF